MLDIKNIQVDTMDGKRILDDFSLSIAPSEVHVIMGPNGTGKSTLSKVLMGHFDYKIESGDILFLGESLLSLSVDERAKKGMFLANQNPISIEGVTNSEFLKTALSSIQERNVGIYEFVKMMEGAMSDLKMNETFMHRAINKDFSGGERKKNEILQMKILKPKFIILDELDSGLDVDSLKIVCENILSYLKENPETSVLMITHYTRILDYIHPDFVHVMKDGKIVLSGDMDLARRIEDKGYDGINIGSGMDSYE